MYMYGRPSTTSNIVKWPDIDPLRPPRHYVSPSYGASIISIMSPLHAEPPNHVGNPLSHLRAPPRS